MSESVVRGFREAGTQAELVPYANWRTNLHVAGVRGSGLLTRIAGFIERPVLNTLLVRTLVALDPDIILFIKCDELPPTTYSRIRRRTRATIVAFHPDDPLNTGTRGRPGPSHANAEIQARLVDRYFIWSHDLVAALQARGVQHASYLPFACDPAVHHPVELSPEDQRAFGADVCFVGNWDPERERWLAGVRDVNLAIWGNAYWKTHCREPRLRSAWRGRSLVGHEMAKASLASAVNLNILRRQNKNACNMRTFEIPATGGFMLHERTRALADLFKPGDECDDFGSVDELNAKIRLYLGSPDCRREIAERGHRAALRQTYTEWAVAILAALPPQAGA